VAGVKLADLAEALAQFKYVQFQAAVSATGPVRDHQVGQAVAGNVLAHFNRLIERFI